MGSPSGPMAQCVDVLVNFRVARDTPTISEHCATDRYRTAIRLGSMLVLPAQRAFV